jgi:cGMP-dependent protein kinase 1
VSPSPPISEYANIEFKDLKTLATVGIGGFGRVLLVKYTKDNALKIFALKQMKKVHILETMQQEHVFNERRIMLSCEFPLIHPLHISPLLGVFSPQLLFHFTA